jgi:hypothetical protein
VSEFTYRTARSGSQIVGLGIAVAVELALTDIFLFGAHPLFACLITAISVGSVWFLAADYFAFGRGAVRIDDRDLELRIGRRIAGRVPLARVSNTVHATWRDIPTLGSPGVSDYRNLMKPATPNVLVTLTEASPITLFGVTLRPRRLGLRLDDPAGFVAAMNQVASAPNTTRQPHSQGDNR